jgi:arsenate reductase (thioredoxin)
MSADSHYHILFVSRRGSARGLMAEAIVNEHGKGRFHAVSAGVEPAPEPEPDTLDTLRKDGYAVDGLRPRDWREFTGANAQKLDFVITLSDTAAGEKTPEWPGGPVTAHWSYPDLVRLEGDKAQRQLAYGQLLAGLERHLRIFMELPIDALDRMTLQRKVAELGQSATSQPV